MRENEITQEVLEKWKREIKELFIYHNKDYTYRISSNFIVITTSQNLSFHMVRKLNKLSFYIKGIYFYKKNNKIEIYIQG